MRVDSQFQFYRIGAQTPNKGTTQQHISVILLLCPNLTCTGSIERRKREPSWSVDDDDASRNVTLKASRHLINKLFTTLSISSTCSAAGLLVYYYLREDAASATLFKAAFKLSTSFSIFSPNEKERKERACVIHSIQLFIVPPSYNKEKRIFSYRSQLCLTAEQKGIRWLRHHIHKRLSWPIQMAILTRENVGRDDSIQKSFRRVTCGRELDSSNQPTWGTRPSRDWWTASNRESYVLYTSSVQKTKNKKGIGHSIESFFVISAQHSSRGGQVKWTRYNNSQGHGRVSSYTLRMASNWSIVVLYTMEIRVDVYSVTLFD